MPGSRGLALVAALLAGSPAGALVPAGGLESTRIPLSVRQSTGLGVYLSRDVFAAFANPALAGLQARTWETGAVNQLMDASGQNLWGMAGGWASPVDAVGGSGAVAALVSGFSMPSFRVVDRLDRDTGDVVTPSTLGAAVVGAYQLREWALGVEARFDTESYGLAGVSSISMATFGLGLAYNIRSFSEGIAITGLGSGASPAMYHGGLGVRFGPIQLALEIRGTLAGSIHELGNVSAGARPLAILGAGAVVSRFVDVHAGVAMPVALGLKIAPTGELVTLRGGFTIHYFDWGFDYGLALPMGGAPGASHMIAVQRAFGAQRDVVFVAPPASTGAAPKFSLDTNGRTLAVATFEAQNVSAGDSAVIADLFRSEMIKQGVFQVVEKANMEKVLSEQAFQQSGCTTQECAVKLGKVLNVKYLVVGSFGKLLDRFVLNIRVVDVETARAVYSDSEQGRDVPEVQAGITRLATRLSAAVSNTK